MYFEFDTGAMRPWTILFVHASNVTMLIQGVASTHNKSIITLSENTATIISKGKVERNLKLLAKVDASSVVEVQTTVVSAESELVVQFNSEEKPTEGLRIFFTPKNI